MITKEIESKLSKFILENFEDYGETLAGGKHNKYSKEHICCEYMQCIPVYMPKKFVTKPKFAELLFNFIDAKKMTDVECYKKAGVDRRLFSKIKSDKDYQPSKKTILAFVFALKLNKYDAIDLLESGGYSLSHSYMRDVIVEYCLQNEIFDLFDVNFLLAKYNQELIIFE